MVSIADFVADIADFVAGVVAGGQGSVVGVAEIGGWWQAGGIVGDVAVFVGIIAGGIAGFRFAVFAGILILDEAARLVWRQRMRGE